MTTELKNPFTYLGPTNKVLPAGDYVVADPCYLICRDELWSQFCDTIFPDPKDNGGIDFGYFKYNDFVFFYVSTAYGDGEYPLRGNGISANLGVDAGCLSIIPLEMVRELGDKDSLGLGQLVTINKSFIVNYYDGDFKFAGYSLVTNDEETEYDYKEEDEENY